MGLTEWLVDTSAMARIALSRDAVKWAERVERGLVRIAAVTLLEIGYAARSGADLRSAVRSPPLSSMPLEYMTPTTEARALAVQLLLADQGHHRAPSVPDLLLAALAERAGLTVLHADKDFDLIADVTGQPVELLR